MPWWLKMTLVVAGGIAIGAATGGAGWAVLAYKGIAITTAKAVTLTAVSLATATASGMGLKEKFIDQPKDKKKDDKITELNAKLSQRDKDNEELKDKVKNYELQKKTSAKKDKENNSLVTQLQKQDDEKTKKIQKLEEKYAKLKNKHSDLKEKLEESGGNGNLSGIFSKKTYTPLFYTSSLLQNVVAASLHGQNVGFITQGNYFLKQNTHNESSIFFMPVISNKINSFCKNLMIMLNTESERLNQYKESRIKVVYPYLDVKTKHWLTGELHINLVKDSVIVKNYLHDPRGSGKMPDKQADQIAKKLVPCLAKISDNKSVYFNNVVSSYQSVRQSLPDKISCGPIAAKECLMRFHNESLERAVPYQYGATELIRKQSALLKHNGDDQLVKLSKNRFRFLGYNDLKTNAPRRSRVLNRESYGVSFS